MGFAVLLAALAMGSNFPVLGHDWVYFDDDINVLLNPHLTGGSWETVKWAWTDFTYARRFMPLGWIVFDGLFAIDGLNPAPFNVASWLLSAVNFSLLFLFIRSMAARASPHTSPAWRDALSFAFCLLFSVHPLLAQIVGWKSGLLYLTATFFALSACCVDPLINESRTNTRRAIAAAALFGCSLATYPIYLTFPLLLALAGELRTNARRDRIQDFLRRLSQYRWWIGLSLASGAINLFAAAAATQGNVALPGLAQRNLGDRLVQASATLLSYLGRIVLPGETSIYYGSRFGPAPAWWITAAIFVAVAAIVWRRQTRRIGLRVLAAIGLSLLPFLGLVDSDQTANDRYALPLLMTLTAIGAVAVTRVLKTTFARFAAMSAVVVGAVAFVTPYRDALEVWKDTDHVQQRLDDVTSAQPNIRLSFTRPATIAFLLGNAAESRRRLDAARQRFGDRPAITEAEVFIAETAARLAIHASGETRSVPYAAMHLEIARELKARHHDRAADHHAVFAYRLLSVERRGGEAVRRPALHGHGEGR